MRKNVIFCDRCGVAIRESEFNGDLTKGPFEEPADMVIFMKFPLNKGKFSADFCDRCLDSFIKWFGKQPPGIKEGRIIETESTKNTARKRTPKNGQ